MNFTAKYDGWCQAEVCRYGDTRIRVGDFVEYVDDELHHSSCAANRPTPVCPDCNLVHRGECL